MNIFFRLRRKLRKTKSKASESLIGIKKSLETKDAAENGLAYINSRDDAFLAVCPYGIGDILIMLSLIPKIIDAKNVIYIVRNQYKDLKGVLGSDDPSEFIADSKLCHELECYAINSQKWRSEKFLYCHFQKSKARVIKKGQMDAPSVWRDYCENVYQVPTEWLKFFPNRCTHIDGPCCGISNKDIIIFPYANSIRNLNGSFWEKLAWRFQSIGYRVFTNVSKDERTIQGTERLQCKLSLISIYALNCGGCIAMRSGICDLIAFTSLAKMVIINPSENFLTKFDVKEVVDNSELHNLVFTTEDETIDSVVRYWT